MCVICYELIPNLKDAHDMYFRTHKHTILILKHKRIAAQLHDQKITMEAEIREELEAEYLSKHQEESNANKGKLEDQLRQVMEERKRWQAEQTEIQKKVLDSQAQFEKVREGFKSKLAYYGTLCY